MVFYQSFCEKLKEVIFCFTQIGHEKTRGFLIFHHDGLIHHGGLNLCASASLRDITFFFGIIFLIRCTADFFLFSRGLGRKRSADFWFFAAAEKIFALNLR